jgi:hypothetical protein
MQVEPEYLAGWSRMQLAEVGLSVNVVPSRFVFALRTQDELRIGWNDDFDAGEAKRIMIRLRHPAGGRIYQYRLPKGMGHPPKRSNPKKWDHLMNV